MELYHGAGEKGKRRASEAQGPLSVSSGLPDCRALGQKDEWPGVCPAGLC